ncbi:MAG TPA: regulatory iron-sulfur-containing complex subunit RicT [Gemmatimonadales bacterium]|nr:regulatory iron-sulfur-containing complex subunit RicT [Gemmatimonadales bacterium]
MPQTVEVRFKGNRKGLFDFTDPEPLRLQDPVIVQAERGQDLGRVSAVGETALKKCGSGCAGCEVGEAPAAAARMQVLRRATRDDVRRQDDLRRGEEDVRRAVLERVRAHGLLMKVSDAEWQWDGGKLTIYFTADQRVDFRTLVRELAARFRTRIELRQIGVRDEAARLSGVGRCGREYCCTSWLGELSPISLSLAKDQSLSLNPSQISGGCGRLLCCLKYEHDFYVSARKRFPRTGKTLRTARGAERVVAVDIFRERVLLRHDEQGLRSVALTELRSETEAVGPEGDGRMAGPPDGVAVRAAESAAGPPGEPTAPAVPAVPAVPTSPAARRRRRRRGGGSGRGGPASPPTGA